MLFLNMQIMLWMQIFGEMPELYSALFGQTMVVEIAGVIGVTKLFRNTVNIKGKWALVSTFAFSLGYALWQYGLQGQGAMYGLLIGSLAALSFWLTKRTGKTVNPEGKGA